MGSIKNTTGCDPLQHLKQQYWQRIQKLAQSYDLEPKTHEVEHVWLRLMKAPRNKGIAAFWHHVCDFNFEWLQYLDTYKV